MPDKSMWLDRWKSENINFHLDRPHPVLETHLKTWTQGQTGRVFVPLSGKSLDLRFLGDKGFDVFGVEWVEQAVIDFFAEQDLACEREGEDVWARTIPIHLRIGDLFSLQADDLEDCQFVYDRAALVALDTKERKRYVKLLTECLPDGARILLVTLTYPNGTLSGPPFSLPPDEVESLYADHFQIEHLGQLTDKTNPQKTFGHPEGTEEIFVLTKSVAPE